MVWIAVWYGDRPLTYPQILYETFLS